MIKAHQQALKPRATRLPHQLTIALGQYFLNYQLSQPQNTGFTIQTIGGKTVKTEHVEDGREWDKQADLERIALALPRRWCYQACAGTFWITSPNIRKHHYYIHQDIWPNAEIRENK